VTTGTYALSIKRRLLTILSRPENVLMFSVATAVLISILGPLLIVFWKSFQVERGLRPAVYSLENYLRFASPRTIAALVNSIIIAAGSAPLSGLMGVTLAWIVARTNTPFKGVLETWNLVPFFMSPLLGAIAWSYLGSPRIGLLNKALMGVFGLAEPPINIYSYGGIIWVLGLFHTPFVYLFCIGTLRQMDPSLEQAARVCGSNGIITSLRITLPLASPAILSSLILIFVLGIEELGTTLVLGYPYGIQTISTQIYDGIERYPPNYNFGAALGTLLVIITAAGILIQRHIMVSRSFTTVTGRGYRPQQLDLGWARYVALAANLFYLLFAVVLPIGTLVAVSFSRAWLGYLDPGQFSTQYFVYLVTHNPIAFRGIRNSLILASVGATVAIATATIIAYAIHRTKSRARAWLDVITTLPIGVPGLVLAIGLFVALIHTPLYGTLWILLVAYTIRFFTYGQRSISAVLVSLSTELEESSRTSGASWFITTWRILLPLMRPGMVAGWLLLFITFMREVSMSLLLSRSGTETLSAALYSLLLYDPIGAAAAFTLVQVVMILVAALLFLRISGKESIRI
jgi:iron(III) transport system permease protein